VIIDILKMYYIEIITYSLVFVIGVGLGISIMTERTEDEKEIHTSANNKKTGEKG